MSVIAWMLTRMVAVRFVAILLGIVIFVLTLEVVAYAKEILALDRGGIGMVLQYMLFRAPGTAQTFLPISMLLALLLVLTELSYRNEIAALWSTGMSPVRIVLMLLPIGFLVGGLNFLLADRAIPAAAPTLRHWGVADYSQKKLKIGEHDPIWMRAGPDILRAKSSNADSTELRDVMIFRRDAAGLFSEQIIAEEAVHDGGRWNLHNVLVYYRDNPPPSRLESLIYSANIKPAAAGARSGDPEEMSMADLGYFVENMGFGVRPVWEYQTWWHKRISLFFSAILMIAICIPLATRFRRGGGIGIMFAAGVGAGFAFFVIDGIAQTMGELGFVTPWLAAWMPTIGFAALAGYMTLHAERV